MFVYQLEIKVIEVDYISNSTSTFTCLKIHYIFVIFKNTLFQKTPYFFGLK